MDERARNEFVMALADYLVGDQVKQSIDLQMGRESAKKWAELRNVSPLRGYPSVEEAAKELREWLWP